MMKRKFVTLNDGNCYLAMCFASCTSEEHLWQELFTY